MSAKWRSSLEPFAVLEANFKVLRVLRRRVNLHSDFAGCCQRWIFWTDRWKKVKITLDTIHVSVNEIRGLQNPDHAKCIDQDDIKPVHIYHIYPKLVLVPNVYLPLWGPAGRFPVCMCAYTHTCTYATGAHQTSCLVKSICSLKFPLETLPCRGKKPSSP